MPHEFSNSTTRNFGGVYFCGLAIFCVLRELIFAIRTHWFFLLGINFCDFQKVPSSQSKCDTNTYFQTVNQYFVGIEKL